MRKILSNCVINQTPRLKETLIKYNNMSNNEINILKNKIILNLKIKEDNKMYRIKLDKVDELKNGRSYMYLAKITGYTREYISNIFTGKRILEKRGLEKFLIPVCEEIVRLKIKLDNEGYEEVVKYFFDIL